MNEHNNNEKKTQQTPNTRIVSNAQSKFTAKPTANTPPKFSVKNKNKEFLAAAKAFFAKTLDSIKKWKIWKKFASLKKMDKEKKFYFYTATSCAMVLIAVIIIAVSISDNNMQQQAAINSTNSSTIIDSTVGKDETPSEETPVVTVPEGMIIPVEAAALGSDYGFYYNQTLDAYYEHAGVDFMAEAGAKVFAAEDGTIESIYKDDLLSGTEIVINHGNGLKTVYRFVDEAKNIKVGYKVKKGDVIATVAEANGDEYKDGAHLHFEVLRNNVSVDPATYLTLEEK